MVMTYNQCLITDLCGHFVLAEDVLVMVTSTET